MAEQSMEGLWDWGCGPLASSTLLWQPSGSLQFASGRVNQRFLASGLCQASGELAGGVGASQPDSGLEECLGWRRGPGRKSQQPGQVARPTLMGFDKQFASWPGVWSASCTLAPYVSGVVCKATGNVGGFRHRVIGSGWTGGKLAWRGTVLWDNPRF